MDFLRPISQREGSSKIIQGDCFYVQSDEWIEIERGMIDEIHFH